MRFEMVARFRGAFDQMRRAPAEGDAGRVVRDLREQPEYMVQAAP